MKILATGSSGYIGNSFINQYQNKYTFEKFSLLSQNLENINFDSVDVVLHCAALVHQKVEYSYEKYYEINVEYPVKLANLAKENGVKQFVFISTIAVYGEDKERLDENTTCNPITPYGKSKLEAEKQLLKLSDDRFVVSIIRPPMVYGRNAPGNIDSLVKIVKKLPVIPLGGIENKRSFISIQNLCHIINVVISSGCAALAAPSEEKGATKVTPPRNVFLACDDEPLSTSKLIKLIAKNLNKKLYLIKVPFFESLLKLVKPSFHKRLYGSLEVNNTQTMKRLFGEDKASLPYSVEDGIKLMLNSEF